MLSAPISRRGRRRNKSFTRAGNPLSLGIQQVKYSIESAAPRTLAANRIFQIPAHAITAGLIYTPRFFATFRTFKSWLVSIVVCHSSLWPRTREFAPGHFQGEIRKFLQKVCQSKTLGKKHVSSGEGITADILSRRAILVRFLYRHSQSA